MINQITNLEEQLAESQVQLEELTEQHKKEIEEMSEQCLQEITGNEEKIEQLEQQMGLTESENERLS